MLERVAYGRVLAVGASDAAVGAQLSASGAAIGARLECLYGSARNMHACHLMAITAVAHVVWGQKGPRLCSGRASARHPPQSPSSGLGCVMPTCIVCSSPQQALVPPLACSQRLHQGGVAPYALNYTCWVLQVGKLQVDKLQVGPALQ